MKKILIPLLVLMMLCMSLPALAEGGEAITLELNTARLPYYAPDDPSLAGLEAEGNTLPVILLSAKKTIALQIQVQPKTVRNKKVVLSVDNEDIVRARGNELTGLRAGEAVLTIASKEDPSVTVQYKLAVVQPVARINLTPSAKTVPVGGTISLTATCLPEDASRKQVTWSTASEQVLSVDENGNVTGLKRGNGRVTATATDGSNIRANISIEVTQSPQEITLDQVELTLDVGRSAALKATVLPKDTNNKKVVWTSSDENVAVVNGQGRITGKALGDCEIICTSQELDTVVAKATVHIQQPVTKIAFGPAPVVYNDETAQLTWTVEPENASNPKLSFSAGNQRILTVDDNGVITGIMGGDTVVKAITTDGSRRQAQLNVKVYQHLTGVHMLRHTAYINTGATAPTSAVLEPEKAKNINPNISWESADTSIATVAPEKKRPNRVDITGLVPGETVVTGTTEDGGHQASILVKVGDWDHCLKLTDAKVRGADPALTVRNESDLTVTSITAEVTVYDIDGNVVPSNSKDPSKPFQMVYKRTLGPGESTHENYWKTVNFMLPDSPTVSYYVFKVVSYEIDHDWIMTIRKNNRPTKKAPVHV